MDFEQKLKDASKKLGDSIDVKLADMQKAFEAKDTKSYDDLKSELKADTQKYLGLQTKMQEQLDTMATELKKYREGGAVGEFKTLKSLIKESLTAEDSKFKSFLAGEAKQTVIELKAQPVTTHTDAIPAQLIGGVRYDGPRRAHVRDYISVAQTVSNAITYPRETAFVNNAAAVAEGAKPTASDFTLTQQLAPVRKIAAFTKISTEMLEDAPYISAYISARLPEKLKIKEDNQVLYGDGTGVNLSGITVEAPAFAAGSLVVSTPHNWDVLRAAIVQASVLEYTANAIFVNPVDAAKMDLTKDSQGNYIMRDSLTSKEVKVKGVAVIETNAITEGDFLVGDFGLGVQLLERQGLELKFAHEDEDNTQTGLVTIYLSERVALPIYNPNAFVFGTFAAAITDLTS